MPLIPLLPFGAALFSIVLAFASLLRNRTSPAAWSFAAGMTALAVDSLLTGFALQATELSQIVSSIGRSYIALSFLPLPWLCFSLTYSRGDYRGFLKHWATLLATLAALPLGALALASTQFVDVLTIDGQSILHLRPAAKVLSGVLIVSLALTLMNLEQTFRAAVGTMRWRIKFVILAFGLIFVTFLVSFKPTW